LDDNILSAIDHGLVDGTEHYATFSDKEVSLQLFGGNDFALTERTGVRLTGGKIANQHQLTLRSRPYLPVADLAGFVFTIHVNGNHMRSMQK
jgi:hypothetical protein